MYEVRFTGSMDEVQAAQWNAVAGTDYPFTRHEFLAALEHSGATGGDSGWEARHALVYKAGALVALMPLYLKFHSFGEYVFDWSWADAYRQHGLAYYPKLLAAIPYTPATGPRIAVSAEEDRAAVIAALQREVQALAEAEQASSIHLLFPEADLSRELATRGWMQRIGAQYHWFNEGYRDFEDFLAACSSRKRKNLRKERQRVVEQGLTLRRMTGSDVDRDFWRLFHRFYQLTYAKRSGHAGYLDLPFFLELARSMPEQLILCVAEYEGRAVAAALNFRDSRTLYGRYWGCDAEFDMLHFEACYYQGIEYCIEQGLQRFDPGAQGEHKIQRGFRPVATYSNHWVAHPAFRAAIDAALTREAEAVREYIDDAGRLLPFKS